ncbi:HD family phosphohydrolase [Anaeromyxobacter diazotrophicus]|uniref:HD family phosphohydrolase n=1 Tax=Anaeromyxobacter diazotrophicus TaxID=2590199 RepID=A0A7I9VIG0_9BACT|nr:HDIG domain-containing metalloprotein [Anaeromyxobacter diazotrophicus]GEJ56196.1 HD family phosphohydrolase [Anaeromyxobacter diazotrophicus]
MENPDPSRQPPGWAARLARAVRGGALLEALLVALLAGGSAWLLAPGALTQRTPGDDALGTPALGNYKAARDYEVVDEEATREQRAAAVAAERPVFDWDESAPEVAALRIRDAFTLARDGLAEARLRHGEGRRREGARELQRAALAERAAFEARLGVRLSDADYQALAAARFDAQLEAPLIALAGHALSGKVVEDRRALAQAHERGIVARTLRHGVAQGEHLLLDPAVIRDLDEARVDAQRAADALPAPVTPGLRAALGRAAVALAQPTLVFDLAETAARQRDAADRVKPVAVHVRRGEKIVGDGEVIERRHLLLFRGIREQTRPADVVLVRLGAGLLVGVLLVLLWRYARRNVAGFHPTRKDALLLAVTLLGATALAAAGLGVGDALHDRFPRFSPETFFYLVPFAAGTLLVRSVLSAEVALLFAVASAALVGLVASNSLFLAVHALLTSVAASGLVARARDRAGLFRVGAAVGTLGALLVLATHLFTGRALSEAVAPALAAAASGAVLLPMVAVGSLPLVEWAFGYLTDVKLLELANLNHPALKDLIVQAPGTYHHAVIMGSLVEAAAQRIGAHALLARVCAYYHDLGKIRNPLYFAENQRGENRHEQLAPSMSALIVKRHVTDGLELARHWGLPRAVADAIPQHHGTRLVSFFWAKAQQRRGDGEAAALDEALFRYAGPKPQTREIALVMIADACEASARALPDPTPERLRVLVHRRINEIFSEGQLDDCELTLKDLNAIAAAMVGALAAVYHDRPGYGDNEAAPAAEPTPGGLQLLGSERRGP